MANDGLTLREAASASSKSKGSLPRETVVTVLGEVMNGTTKWLRVRTPSGYLGFVSGKYVDIRGPKKPKVDRAFIINGMMALGWSEFVGYGTASSSYQESSFESDAVGDHGQAYGLFQWQGPRQSLYKQVFGKDIRDATPMEQLKFLDWELRNSERSAGDALRGAKGAYDAGALFSRLYERPKAVEDEAKSRGTRAQAWYDADKRAKA